MDELVSDYRRAVARSALEEASRLRGGYPNEVTVRDVLTAADQLRSRPRDERARKSSVERLLATYVVVGVAVAAIGLVIALLPDPKDLSTLESAGLAATVAGVVVATGSWLLSQVQRARQARYDYSDRAASVGAFLAAYGGLELRLRSMVSVLLGESEAEAGNPARRALSEQLLPEAELKRLNAVMQVRNGLVHGDLPSVDERSRAMQDIDRLNEVISRIVEDHLL